MAMEGFSMRRGTIVIVLCLAWKAYAQNRAATLVVELHNPQAPFAAIALAEVTASRIYADLGIRLQFQMGTSPSRAVNTAVEFDTGTPAAFHPGALAYAEPYAAAGVRIHVFFDRVGALGPDPPMGVLLGHVIAHELGHILESTSRHSAEGIMKARWTHTDLERMAVHALFFSRDDVESIRSATDKGHRSAVTALTSSPAKLTPRAF
jgi:hypothetical protein